MRARVSLPATAVVLVGVMLGIAGFTFVYARGGSYLGNDPAACANCHVMQAQLAGWLKSSHGHFATCNDCHTPPGLVPKYATKALNGLFHSLAFTTGNFPEPIRITDRNRKVTESACRGCHQAVVDQIERRPLANGKDGEASCIACHPGVGHLEHGALGSVPPDFRASPTSPVASPSPVRPKHE